MKINYTRLPNVKVDEYFLVLLHVLERDNDFEKLVWQIRGELGVEISDLHKLVSISTTNKATYEGALKNYKLKRHSNISDELPENDDELIAVLKNDPYISDKLEKEAEHSLATNRYATAKILALYNLPVPIWLSYISQLISTNRIIVGYEPRAIYLHPSHPLYEFRRLFNTSQENISELISYDFKPFGVSITMSANLEKEALKSWIDEHWSEIKGVMRSANLPKVFKPGMEHLELRRRVYELKETKNKDGKKTYTSAQIANKLDEEMPEYTLAYYDIDSHYKRYKDYMDNYAKEIRKSDTTPLG